MGMQPCAALCVFVADLVAYRRTSQPGLASGPKHGGRGGGSAGLSIASRGPTISPQNYYLRSNQIWNCGQFMARVLHNEQIL